MGSNGRGGYNASPRYIATLELEGKREKEFSAPSPDYKCVKEGDQETRFISFKKEN